MITWLVAGPALASLAVTAANLATWRPWTARAPLPRASALVPARDEEATIEACVRSLLAEPFAEVIVVDDGSTDRTAEILASIAHPRLRVVRGGPLRPGWVGKPHACARLAELATGDLLLFVDSDVTVARGALAGLAAMPGDVISALPRQRCDTLGEALIVPLMHLTYAGMLLLPLVGRVRDPRVLAVNGQLLAVTRAAYDRIGGFEAVRAEVVDDMAFCRAAKRAGLRVDFVDGQGLASCRMYGSFAEARRGFAKNLYEGIGGHPLGLVAVLAVWFACFALPWVAVPLAPFPAAVGIAANLLQRALIAWRFRLPIASIALHPVSIAAFFAIAVQSWWWSRGDAIRWRGRVYAARPARAR